MNNGTYKETVDKLVRASKELNIPVNELFLLLLELLDEAISCSFNNL